MIRRLLSHYAAIRLGRIGGKVTAERARERVRSKARQICAELGRPIPEALER